jgi:two-component system sensor histidine kinase KdpD
MAVLGAASLWGIEAGLASAVFASLAYDFFFFPPFYSLEIDDWRNAFSLAIFGVACLVVSTLAERLRERARIARHREILAKRLHAMSRRIWMAGSVDSIARVAVTSIGVALGARTFLLIPKGDALGIIAAYPGSARLSEDELSEACRMESHRKPGNSGGNAQSRQSIFPIAHPQSEAVLIVSKTYRRIRQLPDRTRVVELFVGQVSAALERLALANEIQETRAAADAEKLRSAILTTISHDLKSPLAIILASASSLSGLRSDLDIETKQYLLDSILEEGQRLDQFIANLLDMSRLESKAVRPKNQLTELHDVVGSALRRANRPLSGHELVLQLPDGLPLLHLDPVLLEKVLFNVLENAAKYTPRGSRITVTAQENGEAVLLHIADEGPGIPEAQAEQLFEKFYRIETRDWKPAGTGLGLAICRGLLQAMGGSISVSNRSDREGAVFTMMLPAAPKNRNPPEALEPLGPTSELENTSHG